jgi:hypothetical protein
LLERALKLNVRKITGASVAGLFLAIISLWDQFPKHSKTLDCFWVIAFAMFFLLTWLGIDQSIYRDNQRLRKMD